MLQQTLVICGGDFGLEAAAQRSPLAQQGLLLADTGQQGAVAATPTARLFSMMTFGDLISSAGSGGSVFANLSTGRFKELPILQANQQTRTVFSKIVRPMLRRIELSQKEISTLSELRETLLPKLISGELRIPDAKKFLEEAGI